MSRTSQPYPEIPGQLHLVEGDLARAEATAAAQRTPNGHRPPRSRAEATDRADAAALPVAATVSTVDETTGERGEDRPAVVAAPGTSITVLAGRKPRAVDDPFTMVLHSRRLEELAWKLSPTALRLFLHAVQASEFGGRVRLSIAGLARTTEVRRETIRRALAELEREKVLAPVDRHPGRAGVWLINPNLVVRGDRDTTDGQRARWADLTADDDEVPDPDPDGEPDPETERRHPLGGAGAAGGRGGGAHGTATA